MALADPQTVTINAVPKTCARVEGSGTKSIYRTADEAVTLTVSHQKTKNARTRRMIRLDQRVVASDPLTSENEYKDLGVYLVIDQPDYGFSDTEIDYAVQALNTHLDSTLNAKVLGGEH